MIDPIRRIKHKTKDKGDYIVDQHGYEDYNFTVAQLRPETLQWLREKEAELRQQTGQSVVLIAYQEGDDQGKQAQH